MIGSEGFMDIKLTYDCETSAVGEGPLLVAVAAKQPKGGMKPFLADPFKPQRCTKGYRVQKIRGGVTVPWQQERARRILPETVRLHFKRLAGGGAGGWRDSDVAD